MKRLSILVFIPLIFPAVVFAAIPKSSQKKDLLVKGKKIELSALEVLALPDTQRFEVGMERKAELAKPLREIAFSSQYAMKERWQAMGLYTYIDGKEALPHLKQALKSNEWYMRNVALLGLQHVDTKEAKIAARKLIQDKALVVRSEAVKILTKELNSEDRGILWEQLYDKRNTRKDQSFWIRKQILSALAAAPAKQEAPLFLRYVKEKDLDMNGLAQAALEKLTQKRMSLGDWQKQSEEDLLAL